MRACETVVEKARSIYTMYTSTEIQRIGGKPSKIMDLVEFLILEDAF